MAPMGASNLKKSRRWIGPVLVIAVGVGLGMYKSEPSWRVFRAEKVKADERLANMKSKQSENIRTLQLEARYDSAIGREERARERGWIDEKAGEVRLQLQ
jgi:hypothetical protein